MRFRAKGPERFWERILGPKPPPLYGVGDLGDAQGVPVGIGDPPLERVGGSSLTPTPGGIYGIVGGCGGAGTPLISGHQTKRSLGPSSLTSSLRNPIDADDPDTPGATPQPHNRVLGWGVGGIWGC